MQDNVRVCSGMGTQEGVPVFCGGGAAEEYGDDRDPEGLTAEPLSRGKESSWPRQRAMRNVGEEEEKRKKEKKGAKVGPCGPRASSATHRLLARTTVGVKK